jgi:acyl-CoA synthetase (NDP forming)
VAIVGNSDALGVLAADACEAAGLELAGEPRQLGADASAEDFQVALSEVFADPSIDSVVALFIPPLVTRDEDVAQVVADGARTSAKTVVSSFLGMRGVPATLRAPEGRGSVPSYATPEDAVGALAAVTRYAEWRATPPGSPVELDGVDAAAASQLLTTKLTDKDEAPLSQRSLAQLLGYYGIPLRPGDPAADHAAGAVACVVCTVEDPLFGPVVSFGLGGVATDLFGDTSYRIPPLTDTDVHELLRSVRAAPLLLGHRGAPSVDMTALEDLVARVAQLADDLPELAELTLDPVLASPTGVVVRAASGRLARPAVRADRGPRSLPG